MLEIKDWVHVEKTPMPRNELFKRLINKDLSEPAIRLGITALVKQGYIRRAVFISNKTSYVMIRSI